MKLGSLFDGIGGFPLSGAMHGIKPVWAAEIEPFPVLVTKTRFPDMKHLGSVTDINGAQIEPVDIITFGSPCQDLSVAGLQKGIHEGARSSLFFEAVRIIKEMRAHERSTGRTGKHVRCRWAVWENVPGAYGSNSGRDFQAVLQALCEVADPDVHVPFPQGGKWQKAGCIVGDGYSVAWRTYDAQYWGVPQRRKRIYLVADFASERAGEILFESEGVSRHPEKSRETREGTAEDTEGSAGRGDGAGGLKCLNPWDHRTDRLYEADGINPTLASNSGGGQNRQGVVIPCGVFMGGQGADAGSIAYSERLAPTLRAGDSGTNRVPDIVYPDIARTLTAEHDSSPCVDRGQNAVAIDCRNLVGNVELSGTLQAKNEGGFSLNFVNPVVYDARGNGDGGVSPTLTGDHENRVTDYTALCVGNGQVNQISMAEQSNILDCMHDQQIILKDSDKPPRRYIVRRLTPLECCRLQGYPDGWTENLATENPTDEQIEFFVEVWARWAQINGVKPKSRAQVIKWLGDPQSDSAEYKAYGNSLAIPCSSDVLGRIARAVGRKV